MTAFLSACAALSRDEDAPETPSRTSIGGFHLLRTLATGGMATVYLGHRAGPGGARQLAAIKVMSSHLAGDEASVQMFLDEAHITAAVHHPCVCRVLDFGVDAGLPYLATEYVVGEVLSDLVETLHASDAGRAMAGPLMAQLMAQACEGIHAAHEACDRDGTHLEIVHRDMAPANIIVGYDGYVRVLDFGIAHSKNQRHEAQKGVLRGRFAYMAPEQMEMGRVDRRADVWSLGVMLWEGAAGRRLFKRPNLNRTMRAVIADPLPPLLRSADGMPKELLSIIERAVVRDISVRFSTARQLGAELSGYASTGAPQISEWMRRMFASRLAAKRRELSCPTDAMPTGRVWETGDPAPIRTTMTQSGIRCATPSDPATGADGDRRRWLGRRASKALVILGLAGAVTGTLLAFDRSGLRAEEHASTEGVVAQALVLDASPGPVGAAADPVALTVAQRLTAVESEAAPRAALGLIVVRTTGGPAHLQVDGRDLGTTPIRIALPAGRHELRVARDGEGLPVWAPIDVQGGVSLTLEIPLEN